MSIKRYIAYKDNTITNAYQSNLTTRGTGSNMGLADSLEVFSIFGQASASSNEQARTLIQFPILTTDNTSSIQADRNNGKIPASGSVDFFLRMFNVAHDQTLPRDFTLVVSPVSQSWEEGYGLDMENYSDKTYDSTGSNWINAEANTVWTNTNGTTKTGGSFLSATYGGATTADYNEFNYKQTFSKGTEDLEVNITSLVEKWLATDYSNYGVGIMLTASQESGSRSFYTKRFSARGSEFFFSRPMIEARWDSSRKDHRGSFYVSSSALSSADNLNTIYFYNYVRGQAKNLPNVGTGSIYVTLHTSASGGEKLTGAAGSGTFTYTTAVTGGYATTGTYSASFALDTTATIVYDRWFSGSDANNPAATHIGYHTGSFEPLILTPSNMFDTAEYITNITNLRSEYLNKNVARFRLYTRKRNWNPTIYTVATANIENSIIDDSYYKVFRSIDDKDVISYGTGSLNHTRLSYDVSGSYFDLDMSLFEVGYEYGIKFIFYTNGSYDEHNATFKFKVIE